MPQADPNHKPEKGKLRTTWNVAVPKVEQEDGAAVLDALVKAARELLFDAGLPYGSENTARYYVLTTSLAMFVTHGKEYVHG
jgi:hypothetical protein